jgi:putative hydrolase of the HAD superfamily
MGCPYLLFDAGGTLVFPDEELLARTVASEGCVLEPERFYEAHFRLVYRYDVYLRETSAPLPLSGTVPPPRKYFMSLLTCAGAPEEIAERVVDRLVSRHKETSLWTFTKPWVTETLAHLRREGIRMSVISNSDGRVHQQLEACGITPYLEAVFDSGIVGIEKPDPELFHHALKELGLAPADALYVGDIYNVDVLGANRAGVGAVHLDPLDCYRDWPGVHMRDLRTLPKWIDEFPDPSSRLDLHPLAGR